MGVSQHIVAASLPTGDDKTQASCAGLVKGLTHSASVVVQQAAMHHKHDFAVNQATTALSTVDVDCELAAVSAILLHVRRGVDREKVVRNPEGVLLQVQIYLLNHIRVSDDKVPGGAVVEAALLHVAAVRVGVPRLVHLEICPTS